MPEKMSRHSSRSASSKSDESTKSSLSQRKRRSRTSSDRDRYNNHHHRHRERSKNHSSKKAEARCDGSYSRSASHSSPPPPPPSPKHRYRKGSRYSYGSRSPRSKSRSYSSSRRRRSSYERRRSHSRSPLSQRRRHVGSREHPQERRCLGVFGLSVHTTEQKIEDIFSKFGPIERVQIVYDAKTGKSRGFCFVYYENLEDAKAAKEQLSGIEVDARRIRVDYSITQRAHTPTPGVYMGKATRLYKDREYHDRYRDEAYNREKLKYRDYYRDRSSSPYYRDRRRRYTRSRSRSPQSRKKFNYEHA